MPPVIRPMLAAAMSIAALSCAASGQSNRTYQTSAGPVRLTTVASGLDHPWGMAFLPDGRILVTERPGRLRIVGRDGQVSRPLEEVPEVHAQGQGGLLDVAADPGFTDNRTIYISYAEPGGEGAGTAVARAQLGEGRLEDVSVIFRQRPKVGGSNHFGSRLVFGPDGKLFVTMGDRNKKDSAQDLGSHIGKTSESIPMARCRRTTRSSANPVRCPRSGPPGTGTCRELLAIPGRARSGQLSMAPRGVTR